MSSNAELAEKVDGKPEPKDKVRHLLESHQKQFELALANNIDSDKFLRVALTEIRKNKALAEASIPSLLGALMASAQLGLEPGGPLGHAYLIPYKKEVQLVVGYKGMEQLAYRSGLVSSINAHVVREGDEFDFKLGTSAYIDHKPKGGVGRPVTHAYCVARLVTGGEVFVVLFKEDIDRRRAASPSGSSTKSPWSTDYDEMARKSAIRAIFRDLPASTETHRALGYDERTFEKPEDADLGDDVIDVEGDEV